MIGADLYVPLFTLVLVTAQVPNVHMLLQVLQDYGDYEEQGDISYLMANFEGSIQFVQELQVPPELCDRVAQTALGRSIIASTPLAATAAATAAAATADANMHVTAASAYNSDGTRKLSSGSCGSRNASGEAPSGTLGSKSDGVNGLKEGGTGGRGGTGGSRRKSLSGRFRHSLRTFSGKGGGSASRGNSRDDSRDDSKDEVPSQQQSPIRDHHRGNNSSSGCGDGEGAGTGDQQQQAKSRSRATPLSVKGMTSANAEGRGGSADSGPPTFRNSPGRVQSRASGDAPPVDDTSAMKQLGEWLRDQNTMEDTIMILQKEGWMA